LGNNPLHIDASTTLPPLGKFFAPQSGFWQNCKDQDQHQIKINNLNKSTEVFLDDRGVPHVFSDSYIDAVRIQGYLHAKDRLFQMDVSSRYTAGRLSEIFGERMMEIDRLMRRRGLPYAAENALAGWQKHPESIKLIKAYTAGINEYIDGLSPADYPVEYKLMNTSPERWSQLKSALINKSMTYDLCFRNQDDLATKTQEVLGQEFYRSLFPLRNKLNDPIIPSGTKWKIDSLIETGQILDFIYPNKPINNQQVNMPPEAIGSNNWAVHGSKTKNGKPILCNDPHLRLRLPSIWYELQIHTPETNVYGVSLPGAPGIIIGFNEAIAWGVTNVGMDVLDWYKINWIDKSKGTYELDGETVQAKFRIEKIKTKDGEVILDSVPYTHWGPVTYGNDYDHYLTDYALRWIGHDEQTIDELGTFVGLNNAKNIDGYIKASSKFRSPAQNMVYADVEGNVALRISGAIPIRAKGNGEFLIDGSQTKNGWLGYVPSNENPASINPRRGFVSSANQVTTDSTYPYPYYGYFADYRGRILNEKLASMSNITVDDMKQLQNDDESIFARDGLNMLVNLVSDLNNLDSEHQELINSMKNWDQKFNASTIEPIIFYRWFINFYNLAWDEFTTDKTEMRTPEYWRTIDLATAQKTHQMFDLRSTEKVETSSDIALLALKETLEEIKLWKEKDSNFNWGKYNGNQISHLLGLPAFSSDTNQVSGFKYALNAVSSTHGPSWRMVVEMTSPPRAWGVYPGGQSGHPGHRNYADMVPAWVSGDYYALDFFQSLEDTDNNTGQLIKFTAE